MKKFILFCAIGFFGCLAVVAQQNQTTDKDVAAAVEVLRKAMVDADKAQLARILATDLSYGHSSGKVQTKAELINSLLSGESDFVTMDLTDQKIQVMGNIAIVRHNLSAETNDNGKAGSVKIGVLLVWQKQQGQWKLIARQAYKI